MVERYARKEMSSKWTQEARYAAWLEVEKAAVKAWNKLGLIPDSDCEKIVKNAKFSVERIEEIEAITKHDLIAFNTSVSESLGEESRWFHYGMTSSDAVDIYTDRKCAAPSFLHHTYRRRYRPCTQRLRKRRYTL